MLITEGVPTKFVQRAEFCLCHRDLFYGCSGHQRKIYMGKHYNDTTTAKCPVAGMIIPELVCGEFEKLIDEIWSANEDELLNAPVPYNCRAPEPD